MPAIRGVMTYRPRPGIEPGSAGLESGLIPHDYHSFIGPNLHPPFEGSGPCSGAIF